MTEFFSKYFPNVIAQGWGGESGWLTAIGQTFYMTFWSFIFGGILGLLFGVGLVLTAPEGVYPNKIIFNLCDKLVSFFRAVPFIIFISLHCTSHSVAGPHPNRNDRRSSPTVTGRLSLLCAANRSCAGQR